MFNVYDVKDRKLDFCDIQHHANKHTEDCKVLHSLPLVCIPSSL